MLYRYVAIFIIIILWFGCSNIKKKSNPFSLYATTGFYRVIIPGGEPKTRNDLVEIGADLREHLHTHPTQLSCWIFLGQVSIALNDFDTASQSFESAYQLDPRNVVARIGYAEVLAHSTDPLKNLKAQQLLNNFIVIDPEKSEPFNMLAVRALQRCQLKPAIIAWRVISHFALSASCPPLIIDNLNLTKKLLTRSPIKYSARPRAYGPCILPRFSKTHEKPE